MEDCKTYLSYIQFFYLRSICCEANCVAHRSRVDFLYEYWLDETYVIIRDVIYEDIIDCAYVARGMDFMSYPLPMQNFNINTINEIRRAVEYPD